MIQMQAEKHCLFFCIYFKMEENVNNIIKQEHICQMVLYNYVADDTELNLLHFEFPVSATKVELLKNYINLVKTINGDDVVYLTNVQEFVDGHGRTYISGTIIDPDLSDFQDNFEGDFSEFLTSCFQGKKGWYRVSQNNEAGKLPHRGVFGEKLELIV